MAAAISKAHGLQPSLLKGDNGVFEVSVDGRLLFSKKQTGRFPTNEEILARLGGG